MTIDERDELCDQTAAGHAFRIPGGNQGITPHKLASGEDRLALHLHARGQTRYRLVEGSAGDVWTGASHRCQPCPAFTPLCFYGLDTVDELRRRLAML